MKVISGGFIIISTNYLGLEVVQPSRKPFYLPNQGRLPIAHYALITRRSLHLLTEVECLYLEVLLLYFIVLPFLIRFLPFTISFLLHARPLTFLFNFPSLLLNFYFSSLLLIFSILSFYSLHFLSLISRTYFYTFLLFTFHFLNFLKLLPLFF